MHEKLFIYGCYSIAISGLIVLYIIGHQEPKEKTIEEALKSSENTVIQVNATITKIIPGAKRTLLTIKDSSATTTIFLRKKMSANVAQEVTIRAKVIQEERKKRWEVREIIPCGQQCVP